VALIVHRLRRTGRALAGGLAGGFLLLGGALGTKALAAPWEGAPSDLDALLASPPVIGSAPGARAWRADGGALAFAWNDEGGRTRDLWLYDPGSRVPQRLTYLAGKTDAGGGVGELAWLDSARIALVRSGELWVYDLTTRKMTALETEVPQLRNLQVSPDGRYLAFTSGGPASSYQHEFMGDGGLWLRRTDAGTDTASRRLYGTPDPRVYVARYEWSADGERIAILETDNRDVAEREIHYYEGGELQVDRVVRPFPGETVASRRPGVVDVQSGEVSWLPLEDPEESVWAFDFAADGERLLVATSDALAEQFRVDVYAVDSGERVRFHEHLDPGNVVPGWSAAWAPEGDGVLVLSDRDGFYHLYHVPEAGADPIALTGGDWEIFDLAVDEAGDRIYFTANRSHPAERQLYRIDLDGGEPERLTDAPGFWEAQFAPDYSSVSFTFSSDTVPPDLYARSLDEAGGGAADGVTRVTESPREGFDDYRWADVQYIEYPALRDGKPDGQRILGRLQVPPDYDPQGCYPMVVGSIYSDTVRNQWARIIARPNWALDQYLVSQGYLVLKVNVRGSRGQGREFSGGLFHDYGGIDTDDIATVVRGLIEDGAVDPERVGIWGNSYGGLMTLMSLFKKPGLYAAGVAGAPATNVWHAYPGQMWVMGRPEGPDMPGRYEKQSALYQSAGLADPLMIIHGTADSIVLYSDTLALLERLIEQNKPVELVSLPGGSHGWMADTPAQTRFAFQKMLDFFELHMPATGEGCAGGR
jgi:dipeptidyl-peptidase-4